MEVEEKVERKKGIVIEFVGVSGAGKTTLINHLVNKYGSSYKVVPTKSSDYKRNKFLVRNLKKTIKAVLELSKKPHLASVLKELFSYAPEIKGYGRLKLQINVLSTIYEEESFVGDVRHLMDEGPFQIIWGYFLRTETEPKLEVLQLFFSMFHPSDKLIVVNAKADVVFERLKERNSREYIEKSENPIKKIQEMQMKLEKILKTAVEYGFIEHERVIYFDSEMDIYNPDLDLKQMIE